MKGAEGDVGEGSGGVEGVDRGNRGDGPWVGRKLWKEEQKRFLGMKGVRKTGSTEGSTSGPHRPKTISSPALSTTSSTTPLATRLLQESPTLTLSKHIGTH